MIKWITIIGFPDYEISNTGIVKSKQRMIRRSNGKIEHDKIVMERILKPAIGGSGYLFVCLRKDKKHHNKRIHQLVAEHFIGKRTPGMIVHHKDSNKTNNNSSNLEYTTKQKNTQLYYKSIGKSIGRVPINHVPDIISRINNGEMCYKVAKEYSVTRNDIAVLCKIIQI